MKTALIIVDVQNDFLPGGALGVEKGDRVINPINRLISELPPDTLIVTTQDWHPKKTDHFKLWVPHCIKNTKGAEIHSGISLPKNTIRIIKGTESNGNHGYSGFSGYEKVSKKNLDEVLRDNDVKDLYICGIATDYCVFETVKDAIKLGYKVVVPIDAIAAVDPKTEDEALDTMKQYGVDFLKM